MSNPKLLIIDITHRCNLSCKICDIWKTGDSELPMDMAYIKKVLSQAKNLAIEEIALSGGEPLSRKDIFEILSYARETAIKNLGLLTNGMLVGEYWEQVTSYLIDNTISLVISLDSLKPDIHNYIRNYDASWQKTMKALCAVSLLKKVNPTINFNVISIIVNQNLEELLSIAAYVKSLEANSIQFQPLLSNNLNMSERRKNAFWVTEDSFSLLDESIDKLIEYKKKNQLFVRNSVNNLSLIKKYYRGSINSSDVNCSSGDKTILISNQGMATTCFGPYGNMTEEDFEDMLAGRSIINARQKVKRCAWPCLLPCFCDM